MWFGRPVGTAHPFYEHLCPDPTPPSGFLSRTFWYAEQLAWGSVLTSTAPRHFFIAWVQREVAKRIRRRGSKIFQVATPPRTGVRNRPDRVQNATTRRVIHDATLGEPYNR